MDTGHQQTPEQASPFTRVGTPVGRRGGPRKTVRNRARDTTTRPFRVWDGEGITEHEGERQNYVLFGWAQLSRGHEYISTSTPGTRLGTEQILEFIMSQYDRNVWNVWFGSTYDVDQILRDLTDEELSQLRASDTNSIKWHGYRIMYLPGKRLEITHNHQKVRIDDVVSFFRTSLVKVCTEYLVPDQCPGYELIAQITQDKDERGQFTYAEVDGRIVKYWMIEGDLMCHLMNQFRTALQAGGIELKSWLGPGAIANFLLDSYGLGLHIRNSWDDMPAKLKRATSYAYFGGRFEARCIGNIQQPVYVYDICSAYPTAMAQMPRLDHGKWKHSTRARRATVRNVNVWALYRYQAFTTNTYNEHTAPLGAFPYRMASGNGVRFGLTGNGWLYGHEIMAGLRAGARIEISESWEWQYQKDASPRAAFDFLPEMYAQRQQYKREGNPAQYGLKLGINSLYGKVAQLVGYQMATTKQPFREPPKHHAWYAGQATSWCRAQIYLAALQHPHSIVAIETDGIYSLEPLKLDIGKELGQWEHEIYDQMVYVQSGVYWYKKHSTSTHQPVALRKWAPAKARGLGAGTRGVSGNQAVRAAETLSSLHPVVLRYGAFTGYRGTPRHGVWFHDERTISFEPKQSGKRVHLATVKDTHSEQCSGCTGRTSYHITRPAIPYPLYMSSPRPLPWDKDTMHIHRYLISQNELPDNPYSEFDPTDDWEEFY